MRTTTLIILTLFVLILSSCNLPAGGTVPAETQPPEQASSLEDAVGTSVALTTSAIVTPTDGASIAVLPGQPTATSTTTPAAALTQCSPSVKATVDSNIRSGPGTVYEIVGFLPLNGVASVVGKNDAGNWWYILLPGKTSDYGWISDSIVETSCLPASVQIVAAPPTPVLPTEEAADNNGGGGLSGGTPDLVAVGMQYWPDPMKKNDPISIMVKVTNSGNGPANNFAVTFLFNQDKSVCSWAVDSLAAGATINLECEFTYNGSASKYWTRLVVDSGGQVSESNEGNNKYDKEVPFSP